MAFSFKKIYSKLYGIDEETLASASKYKSIFRWSLVSFTFAQNAIDTMFLKELGPNFLPISYFLTPIFIIIISSIYSAVSSRLNKRKFLGIFFIFSSIFYIILRYVSGGMVIDILAYIFIETYITFFLIIFYTSINEGMNSRDRKKTIPFILAGGSAAAGTTAFAIVIFTKYIFVNIHDYLLLAALFNVIAMYYLFELPAGKLKLLFSDYRFFDFNSKKVKQELKDISTVKSPYIRKLVIMMFFSFVLAVLVDYQFKYKMAENYMTERDLSLFFGLFHGVSHYLLFIFQNFLFARLIPYIGTVNIFSIYPGIMVVNSLFLLFSGGFYASVFTKLFQEIFKKMFEDPAIQFAYNPVPIFRKGHVISFIEGTLKYFALFLVGAVLLYVKKYPIIYVFILIAIISILYFLLSFSLRSGYFKAFLKKIKTEKDLINKKYDFSKGSVLKNNFETSDPNNEFYFYSIIQLGKKIELEQLKQLIKKYEKYYGYALAKYLYNNYPINTVFKITKDSCANLKKELLLLLVKDNNLTKSMKKYFSNILNNISELPFTAAKEIYFILQRHNYALLNYEKTVNLIIEKPYTIKASIKHLKKLGFRKSKVSTLLILMYAHELDEIYRFLYGNLSKLTLIQQYNVVIYGIQKNIFKKKELKDLDINSIVRTAYNNMIYLWNQYFSFPNNDKKNLLKEYLRKKIIDLMMLLVFINYKKENVSIIISLNPDIYYMISETILYFEEMIQGKRVQYKNELKTTLNLLDYTFKQRKKNKYPSDKKGKLSAFDKAFLYNMGLIDEITNDREMSFMKDIMENLMLLKNVELFNEISIFKLESLLLLSKKGHFKKNEIILKEGKRGENLYIIRSGKAEVIKKIGFIQTSVKKLEKGDWFGELSIISQKETFASVKALTSLETLIIPASAFRVFIINNPELSFKIFEILVSYIKDNNTIGEAI